MFQEDGVQEKRLYSSRVFDLYLKYIRKKHPELDPAELLQAAEVERYEVNDPDHWFSQKQFDALYQAGLRLTGDANLAREAGRFAASGESLGTIKRWALGFLTPAAMCGLVEKAGGFFSRASSYEARKIGGNAVEITVAEKEGACESRHQCEHRLGFFEAAVGLFNAQLVKIEHPECLFENGEKCRYRVIWRQPFHLRLKQLARVGAPLAVLLSLLLAFFLSWSSTAVFFLGACLAVLSAGLFAMVFENRELQSKLLQLRDTADESLQESEINYNNALMTYEIGAAITKQTSSEDVLHKLVEILNYRLDFDRGMILLASGNGDGPRLQYTEGFGYSPQQSELLGKASFRLDNPESRGIFVVSYREQRPFLIDNVNEIEGTLSSRSLQFAKMLGVHSFICCPILYERRSLGVLAVDNIKSKKPLAERDRNLLMGVAHLIGISLHNAELIEMKEAQFKSLLKTLAASIDARDPLTAGHSQQVTEYAVGICRELGLSKERCEVVQVAALLHDYGKIGVPDAILKKPGRLNDQEYKVIQTHVDHTRKILNEITFEGGFDQIPEIASSHHERLDGRGYPQGLHREDIAFESCIISVADVFEAITAKRHYREPMPLERAFGLLFEKRGKEFAPQVVDAFCDYYEKTFGYRYYQDRSASEKADVGD